MKLRVAPAYITLLLSAVVLSPRAYPSMGWGAMPKLADQYTCTKTPDRAQLIDVMVNGSTQRFQGIARSEGGRLVEVAGVVGDYHPALSGAPNPYPPTTSVASKREWDTFTVELQLTNKLIGKKLAEAGQPQPMFFMGGFGFGGLGMLAQEDEEIADGESASKSNSKQRGPLGSMGFGGPATGYGMIGAGLSGGALGSMPSSGLLSETELADVRKRAVEIIERREARAAERLAARQKKEAHDRIYGPPPVPPAAVAPPRLGDIIAKEPLPGHIAGKQPLPGHIAGQQPLPGHIAGLEVKRGEAAALIELPGHIAGRTSRPGDLVGQAPGAVIGSANSLTFTALLDPKTGNISQIVYREENRPGKTMNYSENLKSNDPIQARVTQFIDRIKTFAKCCEQDSKASCDQKFDPESQAALQTFREGTSQAIGEIESGSAMFNPFAGRPAPPGTYGPATRTPPSSTKSRSPTSR